MSKILIIDDDQLMCRSLTLATTRLGHDATSAYTLTDGMKAACTDVFDVIFLDVRMPDGNGLDALPHLEKIPQAPEVIIMTGYGDPHGAELAIKSGAWDYLEKGASIKDITLSLIRAIQYRKQKLAGQALNVVVLKRDSIIGSSSRLEECLNQVARAAASDAPVLITGATGTGKELFAKALHQNSRTSSGKFVVVDCAALPENLVESLLFGHERGAFTGAEQTREGLVRQATGGTLFLDEIGELPPGLQKTFLRVLQERRFRPVGSDREVESNFRLVAATNRNLDEMVQNETFRRDLLFRLRSFVIELPCLRELPDDIKTLARYYTDRICDRYALIPKGFGPEFLETLRAYHWPGNIRELINALEHAIAGARFEPLLFPQHLPVQLRIEVTQTAMKHTQPVAPPPSLASTPRPQPLPKLQDFRDAITSQAEKEYLRDLMELTRNNIGEACRISGLSQSRLYALLKKTGHYASQ